MELINYTDENFSIVETDILFINIEKVLNYRKNY